MQESSREAVNLGQPACVPVLVLVAEAAVLRPGEVRGLRAEVAAGLRVEVLRLLVRVVVVIVGVLVARLEMRGGQGSRLCTNNSLLPFTCTFSALVV